MDEWINKMRMHTMEYYSALKRKEILTHATTRMNLEDILLTEIKGHDLSQREANLLKNLKA